MTTSAQLLSTTGMRGRVAIAAVCVAELIRRRPEVTHDAAKLYEYIWEFVEGEIMAWHDRRASVTELNKIGMIPGSVGPAIDLADSAATEYLFVGFSLGVDALCVELAELFDSVFPGNTALLCMLVSLSPIDDASLPRKRSEYLDIWQHASGSQSVVTFGSGRI